MPSETLWWCLTRACNLNCLYCYEGNHAPDPRLRRTMTPETLAAALPWAAAWTRTELDLVWYGGEPLLAWAVAVEAVPAWRAAFTSARKTIRWSVTTNGTLLDASKRDWLDAESFGVLLSLDGPPWIHEQTRGRWDDIAPHELLAWRPELETVWTITDRVPVRPSDLDWLLRAGFRRVSFNIDHLCQWSDDALVWLTDFFQAVGRRAIAGELLTNWTRRLDSMLEGRPRQAFACGTGRYMLGLSPEGWLYPSQEMVYASALPGRREDALAFYRVGDVTREPVLDAAALDRVADVRTSRMRPEAPHSCEDCCAISWCLGGCHCGRIGSGKTPDDRFVVGRGTCRSCVAASRGLLGAAAIHGYRPARNQPGHAGRSEARTGYHAGAGKFEPLRAAQAAVGPVADNGVRP